MLTIAESGIGVTEGVPVLIKLLSNQNSNTPGIRIITVTIHHMHTSSKNISQLWFNEFIMPEVHK